MMPNTRRVRACNMRVGDELPWFDTKTASEITMLVTRIDVRSLPPHGEYLSIELIKKSAKRKQRYVWRTEKGSLVRIYNRQAARR